MGRAQRCAYSSELDVGVALDVIVDLCACAVVERCLAVRVDVGAERSRQGRQAIGVGCY